MRRVGTSRAWGNLVLGMFTLSALLPIVLGVARSLSVDSDFQKFNNFSSYKSALQVPGIAGAFANSIGIVLVSVPLTLTIVILAAYGLSKFHFKGRNGLYLLLLSALMIPSATVMYPCFMIMRQFGLINKLPSIILAEIAYAIPFNLLICKNYFDEIPNALIEASCIDGATTFQTLVGIVVPAARPVILVTLLWCFLGSWNDYIWPFLFFQDTTRKTVTLLPKYFIGQFNTAYDNLFAAMFLTMTPTVVVYICLQKYFQQGIVSGAIKA
jgi:ABC-type glycerol-3-phosphate transport system permease component